MVNARLAGFSLCLPFFETGKTNCSQISREIGVNERTVQRYRKDYRSKSPMDEVGRNGRPPKVDAQIVRHQ